MDAESRNPADAPIPLVDVQAQYAALESEITLAIDRVCQSGRLVLGPEVQELEEQLAAYCQADAAVGCASGSDSLLLSLLALGIGRGHEVILPSYTFFATAGAVWQAGARPVFVDIDQETYNIDPSQIEAAITPNTRAIIPVHLYGQCADMEAINRIAKSHQLAVVEDACQAIGAEYQGRRAGSLGDIGCFSFYPTKNLGCLGDGGLLTTSDPLIAEHLRLLRAHGMKPRYHHKIVGINSRLDTIQAAVLDVKLKHLDRWTQDRADNAARYDRLFAICGLDKKLKLPRALPGYRHVWNQYVVRVPQGRRDALREHLAGKQIGTEVYYPVPVHRQECFAGLESADQSLPETDRAARETLALPIFPELTATQQRRVVGEIAAFFGMAAQLDREAA